MLKAALLALALGAAAAGAQAAPLFDAYQGFCLKMDGDAAGGLAAATAAGWAPIPAAMLQQLSGAAGVANADGRMRSSTAGLDFLLIGDKKMPVGAMTMNVRFCAVATTAALGAPGELSTALAGWAAMPPNPLLSKNGQTGYAFMDEGGAHKPINPPGDTASAQAMLQSGHLRIAFVQEGSAINLLAYAVPHPVSPN
jgi:hypothetical protein